MEQVESNKLRDSVSKEYEAKLHQQGGFCAHQFETEFGYGEEALQSLPSDAVDSSFGCANPLAMGALNPGDTVVDLGSGAGMDVILAARKVGMQGRVIGVDMTGAMIEKARRNIAEAGVDPIAEIRKGVIESLPVESSSVDWVISNCVVSLSPDKKQVFSEVFRVLKPGGKMLLSDLVVEPLPVWLRAVIALKSPASAKALDRERYLATVTASGLANVTLRSELVYDETMLHSLVMDELNIREGFWRAVLDLNGAQVLSHLLKPLVRPAVRYGANKISSIKVYAEKPL
ncbi:MAG: methyltransferase type 11 [Pseudomonadales bacterium]|nr:methyltransferase type 11 [Pseudomonadales bacterium]